MLICGIDEAGRGPVIGPMVMAGVVIDEADHQKLYDLGARDSKVLSPAQRERLFAIITKTALRYKIVVLDPKDIDAVVGGKGMNLNWFEGNHAAEIINELAPGKVYMDCPSPNLDAFTTYIQQRLKWPQQVALVCAHHADRDHPVVSAASILAKVTRDEHIEALKKKIGVDFGSGYPADPVTVDFLKNNWNKYPEIFRHSWSSYQRYAGIGNKKSQKGLGEF
ncbi:MAG: ribonuclease HII [Nanoarchaeota archaeon]